MMLLPCYIRVPRNTRRLERVALWLFDLGAFCSCLYMARGTIFSFVCGWQVLLFRSPFVVFTDITYIPRGLCLAFVFYFIRFLWRYWRIVQEMALFRRNRALERGMASGSRWRRGAVLASFALSSNQAFWSGNGSGRRASSRLARWTRGPSILSQPPKSPWDTTERRREGARGSRWGGGRDGERQPH